MFDIHKILESSDAVSSVLSVNVKLSPQLYELIKLHCKTHGKSQQAAIREIVQEYLTNLYLDDDEIQFSKVEIKEIQRLVAERWFYLKNNPNKALHESINEKIMRLLK